LKLENSIKAKVEISSCRVEFNFQIEHYRFFRRRKMLAFIQIDYENWAILESSWRCR